MAAIKNSDISYCMLPVKGMGISIVCLWLNSYYSCTNELEPNTEALECAIYSNCVKGFKPIIAISYIWNIKLIV